MITEYSNRPSADHTYIRDQLHIPQVLKANDCVFDPHRGCARPPCSTTPSAGPPPTTLFIIFKLHLLIKYVRVCTFSQILLLPPSQVWCFRELQPTLAVI